MLIWQLLTFKKKKPKKQQIDGEEVVVIDLLYIREKGTIKQTSDWTKIRICTPKLC